MLLLSTLLYTREWLQRPPLVVGLLVVGCWPLVVLLVVGHWPLAPARCARLWLLACESVLHGLIEVLMHEPLPADKGGEMQDE